MKFTYDPHYNIAYILFREKGEKVRTVQVSDELNIDLAPDGTVYGIELLNANEQLQHEEGIRKTSEAEVLPAFLFFRVAMVL